MVHFKTRKKDGRVFPIKGNADKVSVKPVFIPEPFGLPRELQPTGKFQRPSDKRSVGERISKFRKGLEQRKEKRLVAQTIREEKDLAIAEKKLSERLDNEEILAERRESFLSKQEKLTMLKAQKKEFKMRLESFTLKGKVKGRIKTVIERRRAFAASPAGKRLKKKRQKSRQKFFKKLGEIEI